MPSRLLTNLAAFGVLAVAKPLSIIGLTGRRDPWRRACGIGLKTEGSKFTLSAFGLDVWSDRELAPVAPSADDLEQHVLQRLNAFIHEETCTHVQVHERGACCEAVALIDPITRRGTDSPSERCACAVWFEAPADGLDRFTPPASLTRTTGGPEMLHIVCRPSADMRSADMWVQVHHAVTDGAPMQELINRLEASWGTRETVHFPDPATWTPRAKPSEWHRPGDRALEHLLAFLDFNPVLEQRRSIVGEKPTVGALLIWRLAQQPSLAGKMFAATVDVPESSDGESRFVDFIVIRPADYRQAGFAAYVTAFHQKLEESRARRSPMRRATESLALLPAPLALAALRANADRTADTFGSVGVTILRDAKVFLAPMSDPGFDDGWFAIGGMTLPTPNGTTVGAVSVKGPPGKTQMLYDAMCAALTPCPLYSGERGGVRGRS